MRIPDETVSCTKQTISVQSVSRKQLKTNNLRTNTPGRGDSRMYKVCRHIRTSGGRSRAESYGSGGNSSGNRV